MKRVLITRSATQGSDLAGRLRALDLEPILIPTIEFADPSTFVPLDAAIATLVSSADRREEGVVPASHSAFHWLLFTSANAVDAFHRRLTGSGTASHPFSTSAAAVFSAQLPSNLHVAAIGPATARALAANAVIPDLIPPRAVAESLAEALLPYARQSGGSPTRFLLIRAEAARDYLPDALRAGGAEVTVVPAYRTFAPAGSIAQIEHLFSTPETWPDAITFTSSSTATNLQALLEAAGLSLPAEILRISIGPITSQTLRDMGLPPHAEAAAPTLDALASTIAKALRLSSAS